MNDYSSSHTTYLVFEIHITKGKIHVKFTGNYLNHNKVSQNFWKKLIPYTLVSYTSSKKQLLVCC